MNVKTNEPYPLRFQVCSHLEGLVLVRVNGHHVPLCGPQVLHHPGPEAVQVPVQFSGCELCSLRQRAVCSLLHRLLPPLLQTTRPWAARHHRLTEGPVLIDLLLMLQHLHAGSPTGEVTNT